MAFRIVTVLAMTFIFINWSLGKILLAADISKDAYHLINSVLGGNAIERPENCSHNEFGQHIRQELDSLLGRHVFVFYLHLSQDADCISHEPDRQRNEIKVYDPSPETLKGFRHETVTFTWNFYLDAKFQPSKAFTSLHQIKDKGGHIRNPILSLTLAFHQKCNCSRLNIVHVNSNNNREILAFTDLERGLGQWIHVRESLTYDTLGKYAIEFSFVETGNFIWNYKSSRIDLWRHNASYVRPKWGIYRGLNDSTRLRDEVVKFDSFCLGKGEKACF